MKYFFNSRAYLKCSVMCVNNSSPRYIYPVIKDDDEKNTTPITIGIYANERSVFEN